MDTEVQKRFEEGFQKAGALAGKQWQARDIASEMYSAGWVNVLNLTVGVAVCLGESQGFDGAFHDNLDADGNLLSRDVGAMQINIPASQVGTDAEARLYNFHNNIETARADWLRWGGSSNNPVQAWNHWVAYKMGYVLDPAAGGRYIQRASRGVGNFIADYLFDVPNPPLLYYAKGESHPS